MGHPGRRDSDDAPVARRARGDGGRVARRERAEVAGDARLRADRRASSSSSRRKIFSTLAAGVRRAAYFDQAARTVACIAEVFRAAERRPEDIDRFGFVVIAPAEQLDRRLFAGLCDKESIDRKVRQRVAAYNGVKDAWYAEWFAPLLGRLHVDVLSWEEIVREIVSHDAPAGASLSEFLAGVSRATGLRASLMRSIT